MYKDVYSLFQVGRIIAGPESIEKIPEVMASIEAKSVLLLTDQGVSRAGLVERPLAIIREAGAEVRVIDDIPPEPATMHVNAAVEAARNFSAQLIIAVGGGSVMDVAKLVAVLLTNDVSLAELLKGAEIKKNGIPTLMIPTTAGTGAEVTQNAIVLVPEEESKIGVVSGKLVPDCAILDPSLTVKLPPAITAATGMDALTHAIECYTSKKANPLSDTYALKAIGLIFGNLRRAYKNGADIDARHAMLLGATFGGMSIATSSTTAVHALAYPLGGKYHMAHGLSNAILLPFVMQFNMDAAEEKFKNIALAMGLSVENLTAQEAAQQMVDNLFSLVRDLEIETSLKDKGITEADLDGMVEAAAKVTRLLDNNPKPMNKEDIRGIYKKLL